jgi:glutaredoxin
MIRIYGKPGCGLCDAAKKKLDILGLPYEVRDLFDTEAWRSDPSGWVTALAVHAMIDTLPVVEVGGETMSYPQAMKMLKENKCSIRSTKRSWTR